MKGPIAILFSMLVLIGCTTRTQYEFFEPSGLDETVSIPEQAPKNVGIFRRHDTELQVRCKVTEEELIELTLSLHIPMDTIVQFSDNIGILEVFDSHESINLSWQEWTVIDGVGERKIVPFSAPLKPQSHAETTPRTGIVDMGRYMTKFTLQPKFSQAKEFALTLPPMNGTSLPKIKFTRKRAYYRVVILLQ